MDQQFHSFHWLLATASLAMAVLIIQWVGGKSNIVWWEMITICVSKVASSGLQLTEGMVIFLVSLLVGLGFFYVLSLVVAYF